MKQIETTTAYIISETGEIKTQFFIGSWETVMLEKKEDHILLSREEFKQAILEAFIAGKDRALYPGFPSREQYLSNLLKP